MNTDERRLDLSGIFGIILDVGFFLTADEGR